MDLAVSRDEPVTVNDLLLHAEVVAMMPDKLVRFLESALVQEQIDPLARGELAFGVLACAAFLAASGLGRRMTPPQFFHPV
jgi:hypothetical protein